MNLPPLKVRASGVGERGLALDRVVHRSGDAKHVPEAGVADEAVVVEVAAGDGQDFGEGTEFHVAVGTGDDFGWGHPVILHAARALPSAEPARVGWAVGLPAGAGAVRILRG